VDVDPIRGNIEKFGHRIAEGEGSLGRDVQISAVGTDISDSGARPDRGMGDMRDMIACVEAPGRTGERRPGSGIAPQYDIHQVLGASGGRSPLRLQSLDRSHSLFVPFGCDADEVAVSDNCDHTWHRRRRSIIEGRKT
jgi:hypothetical protein